MSRSRKFALAVLVALTVSAAASAAPSAAPAGSFVTCALLFPNCVP